MLLSSSLSEQREGEEWKQRRAPEQFSPPQPRPDHPRRTDAEQEARLSYPEITEHTPGSLVSSARDGSEAEITAQGNKTTTVKKERRVVKTKQSLVRPWMAAR